jgi:phenylacetate-CoA ligase
MSEPRPQPTAVRIDARTRERHPRITQAGAVMLHRLREHPDAPRFNYATGDRLRDEDVPVLDRFRAAIASERRSWQPGQPPPAMLSRVASWRMRVPFFRRTLSRFDGDLATVWPELPTTSRSDLALFAWEMVPDDEPLDRMVIYRTAGTTGHPISVPHHPIAIRYYEPLIEEALARHGARLQVGAGEVACFLVGAQIRTYTYAAVLTGWREAGFAKLNIRQTEWPREGSQHRYFEAFAPRFLTGDPISFAEMLRLGLPAAPLALVTTSVAMSPGLRRRLAERYHAPVIDWYSLVETGPVGYLCSAGHGYHVLPPDLFVEVLRPDGTPCATGERGEITVTGGRNPFAPLVRYRTGDWGRLEVEACACGDPMPRLMELEGRVPLLIRSADGTPVSTVDISRVLREHPLLLHEFAQHSDRKCELVCRALPEQAPDLDAIRSDLHRLLGDVPVAIRLDPTLGERLDGKVQAYHSELMVED